VTTEPQLAVDIYVERANDKAGLLISANTVLPTIWQGACSTTRNDQTGIILHLLYGNSARASQNSSIGRWRVSGFSNLKESKPRINLQVSVSAVGEVKVYADCGLNQPLSVIPQTPISQVPVAGVSWTDVSLQDLLQNAQQVLNNFATAQCGPNAQGRRGKAHWSVGIENMHMSGANGWIGDVTCVVLDLLFRPEIVICVAPTDSGQYQVQIMIEKSDPRIGSLGMVSAVSETVDATPSSLRRLLDSFLQRGILTRKRRRLYYSGDDPLPSL
jgi:hypothetical protein